MERLAWEYDRSGEETAALEVAVAEGRERREAICRALGEIEQAGGLLHGELDALTVRLAAAGRELRRRRMREKCRERTAALRKRFLARQSARAQVEAADEGVT